MGLVSQVDTSYAMLIFKKYQLPLGLGLGQLGLGLGLAANAFSPPFLLRDHPDVAILHDPS